MVLDAGIAAKWFLPSGGEPLAEQAVRLLQRYASDEVRFIVPDLFWTEFGNILWKAVRQGRIPGPSASLAISQMQRHKLVTIPSAALLEDAFRIAGAFGRSVYDSMYVALAMAHGTEFVTADERLANTTAARLPVKWLGAI